MNSFEEIKSQWDGQSVPELPKEGAQRVYERITTIRKRQKIASSILWLTVAVLVVFFLYVSAYRSQLAMTGLFMMMGSILIRVVLEFLSIRRLRTMNVAIDALKFKERFRNYYQKRRVVHYVVTPLTILCYSAGFISLLPIFKKTLSNGFYTYILVSSVVYLLVFGVFIAKQIQKEIRLLRLLNQNVSEQHP